MIYFGERGSEGSRERVLRRITFLEFMSRNILFKLQQRPFNSIIYPTLMIADDDHSHFINPLPIGISSAISIIITYNYPNAPDKLGLAIL